MQGRQGTNVPVLWVAAGTRFLETEAEAFPPIPGKRARSFDFGSAGSCRGKEAYRSPAPFDFAQGAACCRGWGRMTEVLERGVVRRIRQVTIRRWLSSPPPSVRRLPEGN
jgi:hypothetical protein